MYSIYSSRTFLALRMRYAVPSDTLSNPASPGATAVPRGPHKTNQKSGDVGFRVYKPGGWGPSCFHFSVHALGDMGFVLWDLGFSGLGMNTGCGSYQIESVSVPSELLHLIGRSRLNSSSKR